MATATHILRNMEAMRLGGSTIRAIAAATGISKSEVHRLVRDVEPLLGPRAKHHHLERITFELVPAPGGGMTWMPHHTSKATGGPY